MVGFSDFVDLANLGVSLFSGVQNSNRADDSAAQSADLINAQLEAINRSNNLSDTGGDALEQALSAILQQIGARGSYDPQRIDDLGNLLAQENRSGLQQTKDDIAQSAVSAGNRTNQQLTNALALAQQLFKPNVNTMTTQSSNFNPNAYDASIASNAQAYAGNLDAMTKDNLNAALSRIVAGRMGKMGGARSGAEIAAATAAAESASKQQAQNQLTAIEMAMQQASGLQGLATGAQSAGINQDKMAMNLKDMQFKQAIDSLNAGQTAKANAQTLDANAMQQAISQLTAQNALNTNKDLDGYLQALSLVGAEQGLRSNTLAEVQNIATAPNTYRLTGPTNTMSTAASGAKAANLNTNLFAKEAGAGFNSAGQALDKLFKLNSVSSPTVSSTGGGGFTTPSVFGPSAGSNYIPGFTDSKGFGIG